MRPSLRWRGIRGRGDRLPRRQLPGRAQLIALIGDTHLPRGARRLPEGCIRLLQRATLILHVGDLTSTVFLEELGEIGRVAAVHGNMDEPLLRAELPARLVAEAEGLRIGLVHDGGPTQGRHARLLDAFPNCDVIAYGHTHLPEVARADALWIVNPGSPTERRRAAGHTMVVIEAGEPTLVSLDP